MPPKNLNVILLAVSVSLLCYLTHRRARTAMMVGDALELINNFYVDPVDRDDLLTAAMNGMTGSLDEHSSFIPSDRYESFQDSISQEFAGIGIYVEQPDPDQPVRVITPLVDSPALAAGVLPNDQIVEVDGIDVSAMPLREVSNRLKGHIGTNVSLVVRRETDEIPLTVARDTIELESVVGNYRDQNNDWVFRLKHNPEVAYLRLTSFGEKTVSELREKLTKLDNDFDTLVLDLRNNSGGLLYAACDVSDMFLDKGRIVSTRVRGDRIEDVYNASRGTLVAPDKPMAILINSNSASASEIVAACLQDHKRAVVVGERSYGKGTVQNILPLQFGRSALRLTVARYYRPSDKNIHRGKDATEEDDWGVQPNKGLVLQLDEENLVKLMKRWQEASFPMLASSTTDPENANQDSTDADDSIGGNYDPQLQLAVDKLKKMANPSDSAEQNPAENESDREAVESLKPAA